MGCYEQASMLCGITVDTIKTFGLVVPWYSQQGAVDECMQGALEGHSSTLRMATAELWCDATKGLWRDQLK